METRPRRLLTDNVKIIIRDLGLVVQVVSFMALLSLAVPLFFREYYAIAPLLLTAGVSSLLGGALYFGFRGAGETTLAHGMIIASLGWLLVSVLGALPFYLIAIRLVGQPEVAPTMQYFAQPVNAFFESVSGYTSTGLTVTLHPAELPRTLQWWRSFMEWIGGVGVIVLTLSVIAGTGARPYSLYLSEARQEKIHPSIRSTVRTIWWIFILYTGISILLLWGAGMPPWNALNHAMTGIATGGFTLHRDSMAFYDNPWIELALLSVMIFGALSFAVHYQLLRNRKLNAFWADNQSRWLLILLGGGIIVLTLESLLRFAPLMGFRQSAFQFTSALTTTGFQTADIHGWGESAKLFLSLAMIFGGAAGSTAGGIKIIRTITLVRGISWHLRKVISPPDVLVQFRLGNRALSNGEATARLIDAGLLFILWGFFLALGVVVLLHTIPGSYSLGDVLFEVTSAQSNVGLSTGITGPGMPTAAKLVLCFNMWIGRLEIIPVLLFLRGIFRGID